MHITSNRQGHRFDGQNVHSDHKVNKNRGEKHNTNIVVQCTRTRVEEKRACVSNAA